MGRDFRELETVTKKGRQYISNSEWCVIEGEPTAGGIPICQRSLSFSINNGCNFGNLHYITAVLAS